MAISILSERCVMRTAGDLKAELSRDTVSWTIHEHSNQKFSVTVFSKKHSNTTSEYPTVEAALSAAINVANVHNTICPVCRS